MTLLLCFQMMQTDISAHKPGVEEVVKQAADISHNNTDTRVMTYAQQLSTRYSNVATSVEVRRDSRYAGNRSAVSISVEHKALHVAGVCRAGEHRSHGGERGESRATVDLLPTSERVASSRHGSP